MPNEELNQFQNNDNVYYGYLNIVLKKLIIIGQNDNKDKEKAIIIGERVNSVGGWIDAQAERAIKITINYIKWRCHKRLKTMFNMCLMQG